MLERHVFIPAHPHLVWETLTDPDAVSTWFGAEVDWDLHPGGQARFVEDDGTRREGRVDEVIPRQHLRFRWWPEGQGDDGTSEVSYVLEPEGEGTNLTINERQVPSAQPATALCRHERAATACRVGPSLWTTWDDRLVGLWSRVAVPVALGTR